MQTNDGVKINKKHKDTLFRLLFGENKENALSLYNAVNGSSYTCADDLEFTTLEDVVYMKMKNDVSFLFAKSLNLYEHQSSYNPNMPLRGLMYFADLYRQLIPESEKLYGQKLVKIPTPKYVVFYNGDDGKMNSERIELKLSDSFEMPDATHGFEWTATIVFLKIAKFLIFVAIGIFIFSCINRKRFAELEKELNCFSIRCGICKNEVWIVHSVKKYCI